MHSELSPEGRLVLEFYDLETGEVLERREIKNTTTNQFRAAIAAAIAGTTGSGPSHIGFYGGTNSVSTNWYSSAHYTALNGSTTRAAAFVDTGINITQFASCAFYMQRIGQVTGPLKIEIWTSTSGFPNQPNAFLGSFLDASPYVVGALGPAWTIFKAAAPVTVPPLSTLWFVLYAPNHTHQAGVSELRVYRSSAVVAAQADREYNGTSWVALSGNYLRTFGPKHTAANTAFINSSGVDLGRYALTFQKASGTQARLGLSVPTSFSPNVPVMSTGLFNHPTNTNALLAFIDEPFVKTATVGVNVYWLIDVN